MKSPVLFTTLLLCFAAMQAQTKVFTEYWSNGTKATEGTLNQDNIRTGEWTWFHENGNKQTEGSYDDKGNKVGIWTSYYPDGKVQKTEVFSGSGEAKAFFPNGKLQYSYTITDGKRQGRFEEYHANG